MQIVIDASVIMAVLFNEPSKPEIIGITEGTDLIAPSSLPWEVGNAISANVKRKRITPEQAIDVAQSFEFVQVRLIDIDLKEAIEMSSRFMIYAYDAYILCCASTMNASLLCLDMQMMELAEKLGIKTIKV